MKKSKHFCFWIGFLTLATALSHVDMVHQKKRHFTNSNNNVQKFSLIKSKQTDCGTVEIEDDFNEFTQVYTHDEISSSEDESVDQLEMATTDHLKRITKVGMEPIANLSSCLNEADYYSSFTTRLTSKATKLTFEKYFQLDEQRGLVFLKKKIDREKLCIQAKRYDMLEQQQQHEKNVSSHSMFVTWDKYPAAKPDADNVQDVLNCDCKSDMCEFRIKFVAFKDENSQVSKHSKSFTYLYLTVRVNDLNDQTPKFKEKFLYLNTSEHMGTHSDTVNNDTSYSIHPTNDCKLVQTSIQNRLG